MKLFYRGPSPSTLHFEGMSAAPHNTPKWSRASTGRFKPRWNRAGVKLPALDERRVLLVLPREISAESWDGILEKEENDLVCFEIREQIVEAALSEVQEKYLHRQTAVYAAHCTLQALIKIVHLDSFVHDPGEDPTAAPACIIPDRAGSWVHVTVQPDSTRDSWSRLEAMAAEDDRLTNRISCYDTSEETVKCTRVQCISPKFWFPGRVRFPNEEFYKLLLTPSPKTNQARTPPPPPPPPHKIESLSSILFDNLSEVVLGVTNYEDLKYTHAASRGASSRLAPHAAVETPRRDRSSTRRLMKHSSLRNKDVACRVLEPRPTPDCTVQGFRVETLCQVMSEKEILETKRRVYGARRRSDDDGTNGTPQIL